MRPHWYFHRHDPAARVRDPIQGEFFASESIDGAAEALVREGIQNACDARANGGPVHVRLYLSEDEHALPADRMRKLYGRGMWDHIRAEANGLKDPPRDDEPCRFLVFEDFGTTGLTGNIAQWKPKKNDNNPFFYFFRAEGLTDKLSGKGGSWGVGKTVFPRSSRANCFFGYTIRADDEERWLLGSMTLRTHTVEGECYDPDAWFGVKHAAGGQPDIVMPADDEDLLRVFTRDFRLARRTEPGLSIVVPWYDPTITRDSLLAGLLRQWFFPILTGRLVVKLETPASGGTMIDHNTIGEELERCNPKLKQELTPLFHLASSWTRLVSSPIQLDRPGAGAPRWREAMLPGDTLSQVRQGLDSGNPILVRVPVVVRPKEHPPADSHFDICLVRDDEAQRGSVTFVRNGIIIPEVRHKRARGLRALVVAEHGPLADLLRDAEHPAHTHWSRDTSNFREKYEYGPSFLTFVQNSLFELYSLVQTDDGQEDTELLAQIFSLSTEDLESDQEREEKQKRGKNKGKKNEEPEPPPNPPPAPPARYIIHKIAGGFRITSGPDPSAVPEQLRIRVAYDRRTKNPFKRWSRDDFELGASSIATGYKGVSFEKIERNVVVAAITDSDFRFEVMGFDSKRDIIIEVRATGGSHDSAA